jgi:hypothetical protein
VRMSNQSFASLAILVTVLLLNSAGVASASAPTTTQRSAFAALRGAPATSIPAAVSRFIDSSTGRRFGVDAKNVHRVPAPGGGSWSVLSGNSACVSSLRRRRTSRLAPMTRRRKLGHFSPAHRPEAARARRGQNVGHRWASDTGRIGTRLRLVRHRQVAVRGRLRRCSQSERPIRREVWLPGDVANAPSSRQAIDGRQQWGVATFKRQKPVAHAAWNIVYFCTSPGFGGCVIAAGGLWTAVLPINGIVVYSYDTWPMCGNALNTNGTWAGTTFCNTSLGEIGHPYNGSNRYGWGGPGPNVAQMLGGGTVGYN